MRYKFIAVLLALLITSVNIWAFEVIKPNPFQIKIIKGQYTHPPSLFYFEKYYLKERRVPFPINQPHCFSSFYLSDEVFGYLEEVISILQENSINRGKIQWDIFRIKFYSKMNGYAFIWQTHSKMNEILALLGDNHSCFYTSEEIAEVHSEQNFFLDKIEGKILPKNVAYLKISKTSCVSGEYARKLRSLIKQLDKKKPKKWIIDLRGNFGGNMWEMLAGLSPLLDKGILGYFGESEDDLCAWVHESSKLKLQKWDEYTVESFEDFYTVKKKNPFIAVLIDSYTASSAEGVAVAFKGNRNTMLFGSKTYGLSTGNGEIFLSDGSFIALTRTYFFDRKKEKYTEGLDPDIKVASESSEDCLQLALSWLNRQTKFFLFKS